MPGQGSLALRVYGDIQPIIAFRGMKRPNWGLRLIVRRLPSPIWL